MHDAKAKFVGMNQFEHIQVDFSDEVKRNGKSYKQADLQWQSPISGTVYGTLLNYQGSYEALESEMNEAPYNAPPTHPVLYIKPVNTINAHQRTITIPTGETNVQVGAALAIVIGKDATKLTKENALDYVDGYTIANDVTLPHEDFFRPDIRNKVCDGFCPIGPWIMPKEDVSNTDELAIRVYLNGEVVQENNTKNLIRSIPQLLIEVTDFMTLAKGDILLTGVPENSPNVQVGDVVRIEIDQIGYLENTIMNEETVAGGGKE